MGEFKSLPIPKWRRQAFVAALTFANAAMAAGQTENVLHVFQAGNDGYFPETYALVMDSAGNVYGTTTYGGGGNCTFDVYTGCGMIYQLTPPAQAGGAWIENIIWQFQGGADGGIPGGLMLRDGKLYGEAGIGGSGACSTGCGYIFELTPPAAPGGSWTKTALYNFPTLDAECGITATDSAGHYYGVGPSPNGNGSVCEMTPPRTAGGSWTERILYGFKGVAPGQSLGDGSGPLNVILDSHGNLWGATLYGGYCQRFEGGSCFGTIFLLTPPSTPAGAWTESVVYRFSNDDQNPTSGVVMDQTGALYGITYVEAYKFSHGAFTVIGSFSDIPPNGYAPTGGVIPDSAGNVYGTTGAGGQFGKGTVYKLTPPGYTQTTVHSFAGGTDGWNPEGPLTFGPHGELFGTTQIGGNGGCTQFESGGIGCGIVFQIVP
jgi:uncharacterized repeat protein (TIGR03803 family)